MSYTGIDVAQNGNGTVDIVAAIDQPLPDPLLARGPFEFVLCTEVLEHVADWAKAFANIARMLAPGGKALITCPAVYPLHEVPYDFWRPTTFAVAHFAGQAGLDVVELEQAGTPWDAIGTLLESTTVFARGSSLFDRALRKLVAGLKRAAVTFIASPRVRNLVDLRGNLYLSNIAVLAKPTGIAAQTRERN